MRKYFNLGSTIIALVAIVCGFRFVTQSGQGLGVIQNDGYAGTGGVLILLGGLLIGWLAGAKKHKRK